MKRLLLLALLIMSGSGWLISCKTDRSKAADTSPAAIAEVKAQLDVLRDSADVKWQQMMTSDDQKVGTTRLLLQDLAQQRGVNAAQLAALTRANARLKSLRYDRATMAESARIDRYDAAQDSLLHALYPVAAPNEQAPTAQIRNFTEGIQQADAAVVGYRVGYDHAAKTYNTYLKLHQVEFNTLGGKYADLKPLPMFTLGAQ